MALNKCKECGKEVSSKATSCPNCGVPIKKKSSTGSGCLIIILFVLFIGIFSSIFDTSSSTSSHSTSSTSSMKCFQKGNLHNATLAQWKSATDKNKLATASDWLAATKWKGHLNSPSDFNKLKIKAHMLVRAVDEVVAGKETKQLDFMKTNEIAAAIVNMSNGFSP